MEIAGCEKKVTLLLLYIWHANTCWRFPL